MKFVLALFFCVAAAQSTQNVEADFAALDGYVWADQEKMDLAMEGAPVVQALGAAAAADGTSTSTSSYGASSGAGSAYGQPTTTTTTTTSAPTAAPAAAGATPPAGSAGQGGLCANVPGNAMAGTLPLCSMSQDIEPYSGIGTTRAATATWIKKCRRQVMTTDGTMAGRRRQMCNTPIFMTKFNARNVNIPVSQPQQCMYYPGLDSMAIYQKGGAMWGHGTSNSWKWSIGTSRFHGVCHAVDKLIRAKNAAGQTTAARAKIIKFSVCKEMCAAGDTACTTPALCANIKNIFNCRMARCTQQWVDYAGIKKCPEGGTSNADWTHNLDWTNVDPCTKEAQVAIGMAS